MNRDLNQARLRMAKRVAFERSRGRDWCLAEIEDVAAGIVEHVLRAEKRGYRSSMRAMRMYAVDVERQLFGDPRYRVRSWMVATGAPEDLPSPATSLPERLVLSLADAQRVYSTLSPLQRACLLRLLAGDELEDIRRDLGNSVYSAVKTLRERIAHPERFTRVASRDLFVRVHGGGYREALGR